MLSFTHNSSTNKRRQLLEQQDFEPIIIGPTSNPKQKPLAHPQQPSKKIIKTHSNHKMPKTTKIQENKKIQPKIKQSASRQQWNTHYSYNNQNAFDANLKKDSLAAQERRQRAKSAKIKKQIPNYGHDVITKEDEIHRNKIQAYQQQRDREIQNLKALIQQQRKQKQKNDMIYQQKKREMQKQRRQLIQLQKRIQREGPKYKKQHIQKLRQYSPQVYPASDRAKCRQDVRNIPKVNSPPFPEITQSQSIANQKNKLRQQQLSYLIDQRQKNNLQYQRNTLGYTPTLIPLLSRASYKIISTHVSSLVQLFVDDLLEEQVLLLQAIELEQAKQKQSQKQKQRIHDYINNLGTFVDEVDQISCKVGRYSDLKFEELYKPPRKQISTYKSNFTYPLIPLYYNLNLNLSNDTLEQLQERVKRYHRFVENFGEYKPEQLKAMSQVTQQIIDDAIIKIAKQIDNGAGEFVNIVFRGQFQ